MLKGNTQDSTITRIEDWRKIITHFNFKNYHIPIVQENDKEK
jgi:hypothetical protein